MSHIYLTAKEILFFVYRHKGNLTQSTVTVRPLRVKKYLKQQNTHCAY